MASMNNKHIDIDLLRKYYNGELSEIQCNALEQKALDDPFLKEAMEGFESEPSSFEHFFSTNKTRLKPKKAPTFLIGILILGALFAISFFSNTFMSQPITATNHQVHNPTTSKTDIEFYEIIPQELETLNVANPEAVISIEEIQFNKQKIEKSTTAIDSSKLKTTDSDVTIVIDETILNEDNFELEEEEKHSTFSGKVSPSKYLYDLYVIDYTKIRRQNNLFYKRFEIGGVSADKETENSNATELVETEVEISYFIYLQKSMESFSKNQYKRALNRYLTILKQYPNDLNALFYGGLCYFNLGQYSAALSLFESIEKVDLEGFKQEAKWYKGKSLIQLKKYPLAKQVLDEIIAEGGFYSQEAITLGNNL